MLIYESGCRTQIEGKSVLPSRVRRGGTQNTEDQDFEIKKGGRNMFLQASRKFSKGQKSARRKGGTKA